MRLDQSLDWELVSSEAVAWSVVPKMVEAVKTDSKSARSALMASRAIVGLKRSTLRSRLLASASWRHSSIVSLTSTGGGGGISSARRGEGRGGVTGLVGGGGGGEGRRGRGGDSRGGGG